MTDEQTILLVDDSENDLKLMSIAFLRAGINSPLQVVHNGVEAIAYLAGEGRYTDRNEFPLPTVMLLDLNMPMKNGFDVLRFVRAKPELKRLSIIILTASRRESDVEEAYDLGASSYLVKPSTIEALASMIRCLRDWIQINHFPPLNEMVAR
jgi:CheY-like chemotaxis protein